MSYALCAMRYAPERNGDRRDGQARRFAPVIAIWLATGDR